MRQVCTEISWSWLKEELLTCDMAIALCESSFVEGTIVHDPYVSICPLTPCRELKIPKSASSIPYRPTTYTDTGHFYLFALLQSFVSDSSTAAQNTTHTPFSSTTQLQPIQKSWRSTRLQRWSKDRSTGTTFSWPSLLSRTSTSPLQNSLKKQPKTPKLHSHSSSLSSNSSANLNTDWPQLHHHHLLSRSRRRRRQRRQSGPGGRHLVHACRDGLVASKLAQRARHGRLGNTHGTVSVT